LQQRDELNIDTELAVRLQSTPGKVFDAVDAYNHDATHGLKMMRWHQETSAWSPTQRSRSPSARQPSTHPRQHTPTTCSGRQVIDRALPEALAEDTITRFKRWPPKAS